MFESVKLGDTVIRNMVGIRMPLRVTDITDHEIICGPYKFSRENGRELDAELDWTEFHSGSRLEPLSISVKMSE